MTDSCQGFWRKNMALYKLDEYYPDYQNDIFDGYDIKSFDVYAQDDKVGSVKNIMVDEDGNFRYFIVEVYGCLVRTCSCQ
ncbi:PRC-barrel domain-containing protein [Gloeocapsopsis dulcis]|uniref:PRC-barrel domain-containing protein n=2 Tax=Gloeocapsopsis dulcis TaxID=2859516 RepID=UPI001F1F0179|nr:PRC-barrel domain-containing protein [Gloeocapsopsis dulcis]WNN89426.1 PRC-barrel domain-containing protein [Gloeocapsopsis dulcis]